MSKDNQTKICFRIDLEDAEKLKDKAKNEYMTTSAYIRKQVIESLKGENK